jgi:hypothetical protein
MLPDHDADRVRALRQRGERRPVHERGEADRAGRHGRRREEQRERDADDPELALLVVERVAALAGGAQVGPQRVRVDQRVRRPRQERAEPLDVARVGDQR